ncbi:MULTISPECIES: helix-turn-helix transcriptional regulator [unclassified Mucilaginibacter]|uniref:helix-turn-helix domain-containing protein n=1 Tax=unclassified Mucilaginibacter TaxID=2617802 RepID=UPI002AC97555|nr:MULTISPECIES: helix-turn-helix transcriptional regulator [unclassified Mucilaginibacter]MEB0261124.1 helix-turn-helix transcriptional regulator [Mucilaginibacter sp. 10I4]MEB0280499.1 helix-turn-helix transcriptional regulator [Mucilaginibacter sp. 10B2]WPX22473.1 helix-turn-helix transcriptional regulator [Mucilaginibacter sp. 5C4]
MSKSMHEIGKKIKSLRQKKAWSQGDVAKLLDISVPAFSKIETEITDLSLSRLEKIAEIFGVSLPDMLLPASEQSKEYTDELVKAKETITEYSFKILHLQEYVITLYEELHQFKKHSISDK